VPLLLLLSPFLASAYGNNNNHPKYSKPLYMLLIYFFNILQNITCSRSNALVKVSSASLENSM